MKVIDLVKQLEKITWGMQVFLEMRKFQNSVRVENSCSDFYFQGIERICCQCLEQEGVGREEETKLLLEPVKKRGE